MLLSRDVGCCELKQRAQVRRGSLRGCCRHGDACAGEGGVNQSAPRRAGLDPSRDLRAESGEGWHRPGLIFLTTGRLLRSLICLISSRSWGFPLCGGQK